jgi:hypothetical protein
MNEGTDASPASSLTAHGFSNDLPEISTEVNLEENPLQFSKLHKKGKGILRPTSDNQRELFFEAASFSLRTLFSTFPEAVFGNS